MSISQNSNSEHLQTILDEGCVSLELALSETQKQQLVDYVLLIDKWNKAYNLTSVRQPEEMMVKHILDSLAVVPRITGKTIIDVGTGPGLPGIPLAIALPDCEFTLLDSLGKRVRFLKQVIFSLGLKNTNAVQSRVEDHQVTAPYDIVISRAFASLKDMLHWCQHLVDSTGAFFALKGQFPQSEIDEVSDHFQIRTTHDLRVPGLDGERHLVIIGKA